MPVKCRAKAAVWHWHEWCSVYFSLLPPPPSPGFCSPSPHCFTGNTGNERLYRLKTFLFIYGPSHRIPLSCFLKSGISNEWSGAGDTGRGGRWPSVEASPGGSSPTGPASDQHVCVQAGPWGGSSDEWRRRLVGFFHPGFLVSSTGLYFSLSEYSLSKSRTALANHQSSLPRKTGMKLSFEPERSSPRWMNGVRELPAYNAMLRSVLVTTSPGHKRGTNLFFLSLLCVKK